MLERESPKLKVDCNTAPKHSADGQTREVGEKGKEELSSNEEL